MVGGPPEGTAFSGYALKPGYRNESDGDELKPREAPTLYAEPN